MTTDIYEEEDKDKTIPIFGINKQNEIEYAQMIYDQALSNMLKNGSAENIEAFAKANTKLMEVEDSYRIGARLLLEYHKMNLRLSQNLHRV